MPLVAVVAAIGVEFGAVEGPGEVGRGESLGSRAVGDFGATLTSDVGVPGARLYGESCRSSTSRHDSDTTGWDFGPCVAAAVSYTLGGIKIDQ